MPVSTQKKLERWRARMRAAAQSRRSAVGIAADSTRKAARFLIGAIVMLLTISGALTVEPTLALAEDLDVPVSLQVALTARVAAYDRNLRQRSQGRVVVWLLMMPDNADSERVTAQLATEFGKLTNIAGLPILVETVKVLSTEAVVERIRRDRPSILVYSPGMPERAQMITRALDGMALLTVATVPRYVDLGAAVLGVESRSGKPGLVVHLERARRQQIAFKPELLKLARVVR